MGRPAMQYDPAGQGDCAEEVEPLGQYEPTAKHTHIKHTTCKGHNRSTDVPAVHAPEHEDEFKPNDAP